jgi:hypothetical protein
MKLQELQDRMAARPFRPFSISTNGGQEFLIEAEEDIFLPKKRPEIAILFIGIHMFIVDVTSITVLGVK